MIHETLRYLLAGDVGGKLIRCEEGSAEPTSFTPRLKEPSEAIAHEVVRGKPERLRVVRCGISTVMYSMSTIWKNPTSLNTGEKGSDCTSIANAHYGEHTANRGQKRRLGSGMLVRRVQTRGSKICVVGKLNGRIGTPHYT